MRPAISWPKQRSCGGAPYTSFISPRQMCRSEPHTPARVSFTSAAPGSGSGTGYSRSSKSPSYAFRTATRPFMGFSCSDEWPRVTAAARIVGKLRGFHERLRAADEHAPLVVVEQLRELGRQPAAGEPAHVREDRVGNRLAAELPD